jgi:hypothetical protein
MLIRQLFKSTKGNILFSNELARRYQDVGIVSISLFPGAVNASSPGYANSFSRRARKLVSAMMCFLISGGDLEALMEDIPDREPRSMGDTPDETESSTRRRARGHVRHQDITTPHHDHHDPSQSIKVYHRAITSLYAGTAPEASQLSGRVGAPLPKLPLTWPTYQARKTLFQYLTAWARVTLPSTKALSTQLAARLWEWCEARIEEHNKEDK